MKLRKEHFVKLEKPEPVLKMDYRPEDGCQKFPQECYESDLLKYEKDLKEWERKYIKPTPKWKKFSQEKPYNGNEIYLEWEDLIHEEDDYCTTFFYGKFLRIYNNEYHEKSLHGNSWASVEEHKEEIKYFEEHQQIFEGWEFVESKSKDNPYYNGEEHFIKGVSMITIHDKGFCVSKDHITIYYGKNGPNAVDILKLICKDNDIEL